jgi:gliding motility-associated-like protein
MRSIWIGLLLLPLTLVAQKQKLYYQFNQCQLSEKSKQYPDLVATNPTVCTCGLEQEAIRLQNQVLILPTEIDTFFYADFSFGFAISVDQAAGNLDILSKMRSCNNDTSWSIIYQAKDSLFVCNMQQGFDKIVQLSGKADPTKCWQQIMITRSSGQIRFYVNGEKKDESNENFILRLNSKVPVRFNNSFCSFVTPVQGKLDQLIISNFAMNATEVQQEYLLQDEILTQDTLIFLGGSFQIRAVSDCAASIRWNPATGLSSATTLEPVASPVSQTRYYLNLQIENCKAVDSILVKVIDTSTVDCSALRLPTAFTPNDDNLNDRFFISNNYLIEKLSYFDIMDRNGSLIIRFTDPKDAWDGSWNGTALIPGTYYYRIGYSCKNTEYTKKGSVFLMR